jgi:hypothetical protein
MRILLAIPVLLFVILGPSQTPSPTQTKPGQEKQHKAAPEQPGGTANQGATKNSTAISHEPSPPTAIWNQQNSSTDGQGKSSADRWPTFFAGLLTLFTGALAVLAYKQWNVLREQRTAMRDQASYMRKGLRISLIATRTAKQTARAAKKSADALINAERAWVIAELEWKNKKTDIIMQTLPEGIQAVVRLQLKLSNSGRTPAWIIGTWVLHEVTAVVAENPRLGPKGEPESGPEPIAAGADYFSDMELLCPGFGVNGKTVVLVGITEYRDCFGVDRITTFGYTLKFNGELERIPNPNYNRFT